MVLSVWGDDCGDGVESGRVLRGVSEANGASLVHSGGAPVPDQSEVGCTQPWGGDRCESHPEGLC